MLNAIDLARIDLNLLVLFDAVMTHRHVTRAAARLHLSPSAVSHGLGRLRRLLNDPLFLRHPKGVVPTERASALAEAIADILARTRAILDNVDAFDPLKSERTFVISAPEAATAVVLPSLLAGLRSLAPRVRLRNTNLVGRFELAYEQLDQRQIDVAMIPVGEVPARFEAHELYAEEFVLVTRRRHALGAKPSLARYCRMDHVIVSQSGELHGLVDRRLEVTGHSRRVVLAVPSFMLAMAVVEKSDLVAALPRRFVETYAKRFSLRIVTPPLELASDPIRAVVTRAAMRDAGIAWLVGSLLTAAGKDRPRPRVSRSPPA